MVTVIFLAVCIMMILSVLIKPQIKIGKINIGTYWVVSLAGAIAVLALNLAPIRETFALMCADTSVNPIKILTLFISMTVISIFLDETGFFAYLAFSVMKKACGGQKKMFAYLYITISVLTVFTSNDIVILTFTPFICYFAKNANISPVPYLTSEFAAANTWSMLLIIGNPTNIYLASYFNESFVHYMTVMALPAFMAGAASFAAIYAMFYKKLSLPIEPDTRKASVGDKMLTKVSLGFLCLCTVCLAISSYIGFEMWEISLFFAVLLVIFTVIYKGVKKEKATILKNVFFRVPWQLIPFVLSMFVMVLSLSQSGVTEHIGNLLNSLGHTGAVYSFFSAACANLVNNIPMSVLFGSVIAQSSAGESAFYGSVIGSNIGALITPVGALAGIMFTSLVKSMGVKYTFSDFVRNCAPVGAAALLAATAGLSVVL